MIEGIFYFKLLLTFIVGSIWVTYSTVVAQKFGSKLGGVIGGLPSTILIGLFFIGWTQSPGVAAQATIATPIVMGICAFMIALYVFLLKHGFLLALSTAIIFWFACTYFLLLVGIQNYVYSVLALILCVISAYLLLEYQLHIKSVVGQPFSPTKIELLYRGLISGFIITTAVALAKFGGPLVGGIFASFPAVFLSNMIISYRAKGADFSAGLMKLLMLSGTINVTVYATAVRFLYPDFGLIMGTILSFVISLFSTYCVFQFAKKVS